MSRLVNDLIREGHLRTESIIDAFLKIHRVDFVPGDLREQSEADIALPIGYGQTISQPLTVAFMLELLDPHSGHNILDIGSGSGWTTALLAHIAGEKGRVTALEVIKNLYEIGRENAGKYGFNKKEEVQFYCQSGEKGFERNAPYDRILVSASVDEVPEELKSQLNIGGKMVLPVKNEIWYIEKKKSDDFYIEKFPGFKFVPFIMKL
ncbi:MAG: hypothetical protein ACD_9C00332G0001 [uncultured bacterium]|nr:MAG: hypothetical protein ACD_9C00332G0001 [uncultured bacterium]